MPSRILSDETRGAETSTTSTSQSDQLLRSKIGSNNSPSSIPQDKSGTRHPRSHSSLAHSTNDPSSTTTFHHHPPATTNVKLNSAEFPKSQSDTRQRTRSSPSPLQTTSSRLSPTAGSYFAAQPGASGLEPRSPNNRRPPASRSCHGVETRSGPPPAFTTRGSYQGENRSKNAQPINLTSSTTQATSIGSIDALVHGKSSVADDLVHLNTFKTTVRADQSLGRPVTGLDDTAMASNGHHLDEDQDEATLRGSEFPQLPFASARGSRYGNGEGHTVHEDLFLNLAHADSPGQEGAESHREKPSRRSRASLSSTQPPLSYHPSSTRRPNSSGQSAAQQRPSSKREYGRSAWASTQAFEANSPDSNGNGTLREQRTRYYPPRTSLNPSRARMSSARDPSPEFSIGPDHRQYIVSSPGPPTPSYRQPLSDRHVNEQYNSSPLDGYSTIGLDGSGRRASHAGGTESTVSTTVQSTVWDELETLKSRINNLELTGKMPVSSSGAANTNGIGQRPFTAGTTMTTLSSSPKQNRLKSGSLEASPDKALSEKSLHPLLHEALDRSKGVVNIDIYRALETTASDALALAAMTNSHENTDHTIPSGAPETVDRQLRRKADNMCRSLTELCIALSEAKTETTRSRAGSRDTATIGLSSVTARDGSPSLRATSLEPDTGRVSSRAMSRYEARRASIQPTNSALSSRRGSSTIESAMTPALHQNQVTSISASRTPSLLTRRRTEDGERPLSRAMTEVGQHSQRPSPREYTSQHPLPSNNQRSPSVQSSLPQRKNYFTIPNYSPITPSVQQTSRRYLENSTPPSNESLRLAQARRQQRLASLGQDSGGGSQQREELLSRRTRPVELGLGS